MKRIYFINFTLLILVLLAFSCSQKKYVPWEAFPEKGKSMTFDRTRGVIIKKKSEITLTLTPPPFLEKAGSNSFQGTVVLTNGSADYVTVPWETIGMSDGFGFFKRFSFGQKKKLPVIFPSDDTAIPSGSERTFIFTLSQSVYNNVSELSEHAVFTLILPIQYAGTDEILIFEVPYSIRLTK